MNLSQPLTWNEGVFLVPLSDLPDGVRTQLDPADGEFALTRPQGRSGSQQVGRDVADLLERFRSPRTLVEAALLYARHRGAEPEQVLEEAFPVVRGLVTSGYLVPLDDGAVAPAAGGALGSRWQPGDELLGGRVEEVLQVLEDTELYVLRREREGGVFGGEAVMKVLRSPEGTGLPLHARNALLREADLLAGLGGGPAPRFLAAGEVEGLPYVEMERLAGVDLAAEAATLAASVADGAPGARTARLRLAVAVARAYAELHARDLVHGDVHPRNLLVERDGGVRLVDFGLARRTADGEDLPRGGIPFYFEPELARAYLDGSPPPPATAAGEQHAVAVVLYGLLTGAHPRDFSLGREEMLREIAELPPLPFRERGATAWPAVEGVLARALAKDPADRWPSMADLAERLEEVLRPGEGRRGAKRAAGRRGSTAVAAGTVDRCRAAADLDGEWFRLDRLPPPSASINYGAGGVALALLHLARARGDGEALALADLWLERARRDATDATAADRAFHEPEIEITPETVGESSPYHSVSGLHAVAALLARARGQRQVQERAVAAFAEACAAPVSGLDLTLGRASHLLGAAILLDATPPELAGAETILREVGEGALAAIWERLDGEPEIARAGIDYPGMAHGWAGLLYATLAWCATAGSEVPDGMERRCTELAVLARPHGRGVTWPWTLHGEGSRATMPGWCNGSCGYVFLWTLAHRWSGDGRHLELAVGAAWDAWDAPDPALSLCCGLAGRGYALLALHRATGDDLWLERARGLVARGARQGGAQPDRAHCLYKGELGLAVLAADLESPAGARMPLFEPAGHRGEAF